MEKTEHIIAYVKYLAKYFTYGFIVFSLVIATYFGTRWFYWIHLDGYSIPTVETPIEILNPGHKIAIGDPIVMRVKVDKPEPMESNLSVNITCDDGNLITLVNTPLQIPTGKRTVINDRYQLPPKASVGSKCQFNWVGSYNPNPYVTEFVEWHSETFEVVE